jgi:hypothetical protein
MGNCKFTAALQPRNGLKVELFEIILALLCAKKTLNTTSCIPKIIWTVKECRQP